MILKILKEINTNLQLLSPLSGDQRKFSSCITRAFYFKSILHAATDFPSAQVLRIKTFSAIIFSPLIQKNDIIYRFAFR